MTNEGELNAETIANLVEQFVASLTPQQIVQITTPLSDPQIDLLNSVDEQQYAATWNGYAARHLADAYRPEGTEFYG